MNHSSSIHKLFTTRNPPPKGRWVGSCLPTHGRQQEQRRAAAAAYADANGERGPVCAQRRTGRTPLLFKGIV